MPKVLLILGGGANIGAAVANKFAKGGYKVAIAARSVVDGLDDSTGFLNIRADLSDPAVVPNIFDKARAKFGPPSVVVYNGTLRSSQDLMTTSPDLSCRRPSSSHGS
jgi:NAD(P)-dependent dehydrogenase (short-subunit alcohol dehydrogenase family)